MSDSAEKQNHELPPSLPQAKAQLEHDIRAYAYAVEAGDVLAASINISNAIDALIAAVRRSGESNPPVSAGQPERLFPIQGGPAIPWSVIGPCEQQAKANHDQTLERLAERGGLDSSEACAVLLGLTWPQLIEQHGPVLESTHQKYNDLMLEIVAKRRSGEPTR